jgi:predicted nucleic acid-binding protein
MIAGIVVANRATLVTGNVRHFDDVSIPIISPWQTDQ